MAFQIGTGSYSGTGASQNIAHGINLQTFWFLLICKDAAANEAAGQNGFVTDAYTAGNSTLNFTRLLTTGITAVGGTNFTVGTHAGVNQNGQTYYWVMVSDDGTAMRTGQYTGDGLDDRNLDVVTWQPEVMIITTDAVTNIEPAFRTVTPTGDNCSVRMTDLPNTPDLIQSFRTTGFQVGANAEVNTNARVYNWLAFRSVAGSCAIGNYTGDASDDRVINHGTSLTPKVVLTKNITNSTGELLFRTDAMSGDATLRIGDFSENSAALTANWVQSLGSNGFTIGSAAQVNKGGATPGTYDYISLGTTQPAPAVSGSVGASGLSSPFTVFPTPYAMFKAGLELSNILKNVKVQ